MRKLVVTIEQGAFGAEQVVDVASLFIRSDQAFDVASFGAVGMRLESDLGTESTSLGRDQVGIEPKAFVASTLIEQFNLIQLASPFVVKFNAAVTSHLVAAIAAITTLEVLRLVTEPMRCFISRMASFYSRNTTINFQRQQIHKIQEQ